MVGSIDDSMRLSITRLKNLARVDDRDRIWLAREDHDRAPQDVERVQNVAVEMPSHLLAWGKDHVMNPDVIGQEHRREGLYVRRGHVASLAEAFSGSRSKSSAVMPTMSLAIIAIAPCADSSPAILLLMGGKRNTMNSRNTDGVLRELELVVVGILLAWPTADAADSAELTGLEVDDAEELFTRLEAAGAILCVGRA